MKNKKAAKVVKQKYTKRKSTSTKRTNQQLFDEALQLFPKQRAKYEEGLTERLQNEHFEIVVNLKNANLKMEEELAKSNNASEQARSLLREIDNQTFLDSLSNELRLISNSFELTTGAGGVGSPVRSTLLQAASSLRQIAEARRRAAGLISTVNYQMTDEEFANNIQGRGI